MTLQGVGSNLKMIDLIFILNRHASKFAQRPSVCHE